MISTLDVQGMYLGLLRNYLTRYGEDELAPVRATNHPVIRRALNIMARGNIKLVRSLPF
jgi:hypothetical protein